VDGPTDYNAKDLQGKLLLADPSLRDSNFYRSVILLAEHSSENGAFGLVLNHPTGKKVGEILTDPEFSALANIRVFAGGPVGRDHLTFAALWAEGDYFGYSTRMSAEQAIQFTKKPGAVVHAFIGYSGWAKDQLEDELECESWHPVKVPMSILHSTHDQTLWTQSLRNISAYHHILTLAPDNLLAN